MSNTTAPGGKLSREEHRRNKDLEAARKAGTAAPALDEDGRAINPHIPEFMAVAPWYMDTGDGPSLKHQKHAGGLYNDDPGKLKERFDRGKKAGPSATTFRKGACTNCGAITHKLKDCLERPRKVGAKFSGKNIASDEILHDDNAGLNGIQGMGDWDVKRDRWDGYDPASHKSIVLEHEALEVARRKLREEAIDKGDKGMDVAAINKAAKLGKSKKKKRKEDEEDFGSDSDSEGSNHGGNGGGGAEDENDEDKYAEGADVAGQRMDAKTRVTVRNLRIREDTAKYLMNLDLESAYYDPKTRSMREAPEANVRPEDAVFAGDNFERHSGSANDVQKLQLFAWQSSALGQSVHVNANPTQSHLAHRSFLEKKEVMKESSEKTILEKYGGEKYLERMPRELAAGQTEGYVEYDRRGVVVKGQERAKAKSKYEEDLFPGNHSTVFGSYYSAAAGSWGFACCHSSSKSSYCAGLAAIEAEATQGQGGLGMLTLQAQVREKSMLQIKQDESRDAGAGKRKALGLEDGAGRKRANLGEGDDVDARIDKGKLKEALEGKSSSFAGKEVTEEDMEAYRMQRDQGREDPMAQVKGDELLPM